MKFAAILFTCFVVLFMSDGGFGSNVELQEVLTNEVLVGGLLAEVKPIRNVIIHQDFSIPVSRAVDANRKKFVKSIVERVPARVMDLNETKRIAVWSRRGLEFDPKLSADLHILILHQKSEKH